MYIYNIFIIQLYWMQFGDTSSVPQPQTVSPLNLPNTGMTPTVYSPKFWKLFGVSCIGIWLLLAPPGYQELDNTCLLSQSFFPPRLSLFLQDMSTKIFVSILYRRTSGVCLQTARRKYIVCHSYNNYQQCLTKESLKWCTLVFEDANRRRWPVCHKK